ncbi:hypothetical protein [Streptomyces longispororuber]|uniref:hypothetical protein n=1 Tax=Streptomyces longispororuber TaxID=68230 RepID=UPI00210B7ADE|nr:hypothetical protein [Streptomyces longispororuber]MCQ4208610.1 hypothetical protein [Streptomyces longispororuber]
MHSLPALLSRRLSRRVLLPLAAAAGLLAGAAAPALADEPCGSVVVAPLESTGPTAEPCTSKDAVVCRIREMNWPEKVVARDVRQDYHGLLEDMRRTQAEMRDAGAFDEDVARRMVDMRNDAKEITRAGMSPEEVAVLEARNTAKYGNPLGPTADQLYAKYGSWQQVIDASTRTSAAVDHELGLEYRPCPV